MSYPKSVGVLNVLAAKDYASTRRLMRLVKQRRAILKGGFTFIPPDLFTFHIHHTYDSTRPARRRAKLGRA